jgi:hypothetical protein
VFIPFLEDWQMRGANVGDIWCTSSTHDIKNIIIIISLSICTFSHYSRRVHSIFGGLADEWRQRRRHLVHEQRVSVAGARRLGEIGCVFLFYLVFVCEMRMMNAHTFTCMHTHTHVSSLCHLISLISFTYFSTRARHPAVQQLPLDERAR